MEHACGKCGAVVEDGVAFCPHCRAPQIRVMGFESVAAAAEPDQPAPSASLPIPRLPAYAVAWPQALPAAALGGVAAILAMGIPFAVWGPAYALGGALAVLIYRARSRNLMSPAAGAKIGAASGGFAFLIIAIITAATYVYHPEELRKGIADSITQLSARGYDAQGTQQALEMLRTSGGLGFFVAFGLAMLMIVFVAGSSIGGALCAGYFRRRGR